MAQYIEIFEDIGLAKNEARIYETLLREGESGVGIIAAKSRVHRRNVYDSMSRLIERGLAFERITSTEHLYQATDPKKLIELIKEKEEKIQLILPELESLYATVPHIDDVVMYRGIEGWKNYLRDIIRVGEDVYTIGGKGTWQDVRLTHVRAQTAREAKKKNIRMYWLFDPDVTGVHESFVQEGFNVEYRYLPKGYNSKTAIDIFGDHVVIITDPTPGEIADDTSFVVLINQNTADSFRTWHALLWKMSDERSGTA